MLIRSASSSSHLPDRLTDDRSGQKPQPEVAPDRPCAAIRTSRKDLELPQSIRPSHVLTGDVEQVSGLRDRDRRAARARATTTARISDVEKSIPRRRPSWTAPGAVQYPVPDLESLLSQDRVIEQMQISPYPFRGLSALVDLGLQEGQYIDADRLPARHDRPPRSSSSGQHDDLVDQLRFAAPDSPQSAVDRRSQPWLVRLVVCFNPRPCYHDPKRER